MEVRECHQELEVQVGADLGGNRLGQPHRQEPEAAAQENREDMVADHRPALHRDLVCRPALEGEWALVPENRPQASAPHRATTRADDSHHLQEPVLGTHHHVAANLQWGRRVASWEW